MAPVKNFAAVLLLLVFSWTPCWSENERQPADPSAAIVWRSDYLAAIEDARSAEKMALVWFRDPADRAADDAWEADVLSLPAIEQRIARTCMAAKVPLDAQVATGGQPIKLLEHGAFAELHQGPGLAMIDRTDKTSPQYGYVVSVVPFNKQRISADKLAVLLDLPPGSLTQRTLIWAVRTHPDHPASAMAGLHPLLAEEAQKHSAHQARINLQGHHNWDQRFQSINARLPDGLVAYEVCAESWPGQSLIEAAEECVHSWRQSSGHWNQVSTQAEYFGYDMCRGTGGVWYATGIFARKR